MATDEKAAVAAAAAARTAEPARSRNTTVWVENKLPWGLDIWLEEQGINDQGKEVYLPRYDTCVHLKGANSSNVVGGYGLTEVDAAFWEAWVKKHDRYEPLRSGAIKAQATRDRAAAQAMDEQALTTRLEPIDPDKPGAGLERVPEKEQKAAAAMRGGF